MYLDRRPGIEVPQLVRPQAVKRGEILAREQEVNRSRGRPRTAETRRQRLARDDDVRGIGLPKISALRVRLELQLLNPVLRAPIFRIGRHDRCASPVATMKRFPFSAHYLGVGEMKCPAKLARASIATPPGS